MFRRESVPLAFIPGHKLCLSSRCVPDTRSRLFVAARCGEEAVGRNPRTDLRVVFRKETDGGIRSNLRELRSQYTVGYYPANPVKDEKFRKIRVATTNKDYLSHEFRPDPGALLHRVSRQSFTP